MVHGIVRVQNKRGFADDFAGGSGGDTEVIVQYVEKVHRFSVVFFMGNEAFHHVGEDVLDGGSWAAESVGKVDKVHDGANIEGKGYLRMGVCEGTRKHATSLAFFFAVRNSLH